MVLKNDAVSADDDDAGYVKTSLYALLNYSWLYGLRNSTILLNYSCLFGLEKFRHAV